MKKIKTIFDRDWEGNRGVVDKVVVQMPVVFMTEKVDGTNVRLTVRNHNIVRVEKRNNPSKIQKKQGIEEPWYIEAYESEPSDKWIWEAVRGTDLSEVPDGEWSGEAVGEKIQGNPLKLEGHKVILFSLPSVREKITFVEGCEPTFDELKEWLPKQKSLIGNDCGIEGIVYWGVTTEKPEGKIKLKDFKG